MPRGPPTIPKSSRRGRPSRACRPRSTGRDRTRPAYPSRRSGAAGTGRARPSQPSGPGGAPSADPSSCSTGAWRPPTPPARRPRGGPPRRSPVAPAGAPRTPVRGRRRRPTPGGPSTRRCPSRPVSPRRSADRRPSSCPSSPSRTPTASSRRTAPGEDRRRPIRGPWPESVRWGRGTRTPCRRTDRRSRPRRVVAAVPPRHLRDGRAGTGGTVRPSRADFRFRAFAEMRSPK
mmetsp:Transcript_46378/g.140474  ORF Transcript_46378/g.140474 Transcript_46378/m.140474 type:complete len:232 (-) Transcript_46378:382-1077(-)